MANKDQKHYGVLFNRKSGKIVQTIEQGMGDAFLRMFALQGKVSKTRDYVVFGAEDGIITYYAEGKANDMPTRCEDMEGKHIDTIAEGLLEGLNKMNKQPYKTLKGVKQPL